MWPFKKKKQIKKTVADTFKTVICIPGNWKDWNEFILSIISETKGDYIAAGGILMNVSSQKHFEIEFCDRDKKMQQAFQYAGMASGVTESFLDEIGQHRYVVYISAPTGNLEDTRHIAAAADAILRSGGTGVKIETAGIAFEKEQWQLMLQDAEEAVLYKMFVADCIMNEKGEVYSCGMHNLGLKDTVVAGLAFQEAVQLIRFFGYYQIVDKPTILNGQTFTPAQGSPVYRIADEKKQPSAGISLFENPFGIWKLTCEN